ncbi:MAG: 3-phosphoshikimate 1-carboxyvinyltransferase [Bacteroidetes bacterium]|nr:3-phosphoshikimate 1-carboxyvinyltransferase [Bacteroidota bacterium]MBU1114234.1 3-phosphoshikimate 1-carboxyvinyltransferase [Bacteroidota bacterium]MBU1798003.1 3-phosphoshikimate 1-carboxyvinyltransferase [Bacteroidota bacterium]
MIQKIEKINSVKGELVLPGDKSISHRAVMFSAMADGKSTVNNYLNSEDVNSTIGCFRKLGCKIEQTETDLVIDGKGFNGFTKPSSNLDAGNSGTTTRLITGILSAQNFETTIIGDASLSKRPMKRVVEPLSKMGAKIETSEIGSLPMKIIPSSGLKAIEFDMQVASAQVKSAVLLAGLHLEEETIVIEHSRTRNHTETLLGLKVEEFDGMRKIYSSKKNYPKPANYIVPSDISTAAFFIVLALNSNNSELLLKNVLLNETRNGIIKILQKMNGRIEIENTRESSGEKLGDLRIFSSKLKNIEINEEIIPNIIDEIPILAVAGLFSEGKFIIRNAEELRFKESDRIDALCSNFRKLGIDCIEYNDGFEISGKVFNENILIESYHDHRIAMAFSILGMLTGKNISINDFESVAVSNPEFLNQINIITVN